jgi:opacity protein-like surface antigen
MRAVLLLVMGAVAALPQSFQVGVKAGVPMTDFFDTVRSPNFGFNSNTQRYIIGPTVQLGLPLGFAVELDALYRHFNYQSSGNLVDVFQNKRTTGNAWEFPLLLKYRFPAPVVRPFVDAGIAWDTLSGLKQSVVNTFIPGPNTMTTTTSNPAELQNSTTKGFVIGAGLDIHVLLHLTPEIRYTRWGEQHFAAPGGSLLSNRNQAEFLLGVTF